LAVEFKFPDIGEGVMEGEVTKWLVKEGDYVKRDQPLVEVMTEKVTVEFPSPVAGTVLKIMAKAGETIRVGQTVVVLGEKGETVQTQSVATATTASPVYGDSQKTAQPVMHDKIIATPAIRKLARELNVDLATVQATGPGGRITEEDVRNTSKRAAQPIVQVEGLEERIPFKGIRKTIAERMARSKNIAAHVTHVEEIDFTELVSAREKAKAIAQKSNLKMTYLPFIVKAIIGGLQKYSHLNASLDDLKKEILVKKYYNIGIAVATENGLIVPVIKDADKKNLMQIAQEIEELSDKARKNTLTLNETRGGTFTITNIGSVGGVFSTAIINHPEVAILAIGRIVKRPAVKDGNVVVRDMVNFSLNFDHRVLDGADAANFLNMVKQSLEDPDFEL
jgi:pyruvate dehydrogenase E2 component (dihydrolipoamide acetyltransferase)